MEKQIYLITDAAKQVKVENHVLRYWEEELGLEIHRNEMGHRYYSEEDIERFIKIKELKDQGIQLKAIRTMIQNKKQGENVNRICEQPFNIVRFSTINQNSHGDRNSCEIAPVIRENTITEEKVLRLQELLRQLIGDTVKENTREIYEEVKDSILKEIDYQFRTQEEKEEKREEERIKREEEHYKNIDAILREKTKRKKHSIF